MKTYILTAILVCLTIFKANSQSMYLQSGDYIDAQTIGLSSDSVQSVLKWYATKYPRDYKYNDEYKDGKLTSCLLYGVYYDKHIPINKIFIFKGDTLNKVEIQYLKYVSKYQLIAEFDHDETKIKIGSLYFSKNLKFYWEIILFQEKYPTTIYRKVNIEKLPKEVKVEYNKQLLKK